MNIKRNKKKSLNRILVTGGLGFIGYHLIKSLLNQGHSIICIDNFDSSHPLEQTKFKMESFKKNKNYIFYKTDVRKKNHIEQIFQTEKPDKIIHLAAKVGIRPSVVNPHLYEEVNVKGTLNMLEIAKKHQIKQFVFASSSSVYGNSTAVPFTENSSTDSQISPYGATKKMGEILCKTYSNLYHLPTVCLRFFTVYGSFGRPDMSPYLFTEAIYNSLPIKKYGTGNSKRDYTYIDDIITGIQSALRLDKLFEIINLGGGQSITLNDFIKLIESLLNKKALITPYPEQDGDVRQTRADITKASDLLDYHPAFKLKEGMRHFIEWYLMTKRK